MATEQPGTTTGMIARIKNLLLTPKAEWDKIDAEPATVQGLMTGWVAPLAAIGPVALLIGSQAFGYTFFGVTWRPPLLGSVANAVVSYVLALAGTYVLSLVIDALAPSFGGTKNPIQALKVAAYAGTASWLAQVFYIVPLIGMLAILGLYSLYLFYLGLPKLMRVPQDKATGYVVVTILAAVVLFLVIGAVVGAAGAALMPRAVPSLPYG